MRVVITVASLEPEYGGPSAKALSLAAALRELGHDVAVIGCDAGDARGATGLGMIGRFHGTPVPRTVRPLVRAVRDADVLHILGFRDPVGTTAALVARASGVPYMVEPAGMLQPRLRSLRVKQVFDTVIGDPVTRGASMVIATSRAEARELLTAGVEEPRIRLRFNGVHLDQLFPLPERGRLRSQLHIDPDVPLLLSLGRIAAIKGLAHVAQAVARVPEVHWLVVGPDEGDGTLPTLRRVIDAHQVGDRVTVLPTGLWGRAKAEALADADAFCMASESESFGSAAAEAACAGLPVSLTDACGVLDCLDPAAIRVFRYGDVDAIAGAITSVVGDPDIKRAAADAAPRLRAELDWDAVVHEQVLLYTEAGRRVKAGER